VWWNTRSHVIQFDFECFTNVRISPSFFEIPGTGLAYTERGIVIPLYFLHVVHLCFGSLFRSILIPYKFSFAFNLSFESFLMLVTLEMTEVWILYSIWYHYSFEIASVILHSWESLHYATFCRTLRLLELVHIDINFFNSDCLVSRLIYQSFCLENPFRMPCHSSTNTWISVWVSLSSIVIPRRAFPPAPIWSHKLTQSVIRCLFVHFLVFGHLLQNVTAKCSCFDGDWGAFVPYIPLNFYLKIHSVSHVSSHHFLGILPPLTIESVSFHH